MQQFLQKDTLEQLGIFHFDSWAVNFGEQTTALELDVTGSGFRSRTRFNKFINLPELMNIFRETADICGDLNFSLYFKWWFSIGMKQLNNNKFHTRNSVFDTHLGNT